MRTEQEIAEVAKVKFKEPAVAQVCSVIAWLELIAAIVLSIFAVTLPGLSRAPDAGSFIFTIIGLFFTSLFFFAMARVIILLAQIEHNTRK